VKKGIAFFDFDGTITTHDTLLEFIRFVKGRKRYYLGLLKHLPSLLLFKLKLISNQRAKEKILTYFFKNMSAHDFETYCQQFTTDRLPQLIRPRALQEIRKLKELGYVIVIVSASPESWINSWAARQGAVVIASQLDMHDGKLTGKLKGKNCHGPEKLRRIQEQYSLSEFDEVYAYGDSAGDKPMFTIAHSSFFKPFRK
jgi:phosphatidylglycerophosphatase C